MPEKKKSIRDLVLEYFKMHPNAEMPHGPVVDWVEEEYLKEHENRPRDTWRSIRNLHEEGLLIQIKKGIYKYNPAASSIGPAKNFTKKVKEEILIRDGHRCVYCGRSEQDGTKLHIDHIKPRSRGGKSTLENGQTLCSKHNIHKKNYGQYEFGRKLFVELQENALKNKDDNMIIFCRDVLTLYDKYEIDT